MAVPVVVSREGAGYNKNEKRLISMGLYEKTFDAGKILATLEYIDDICHKKGIKPHILVVGGSAFSLYLFENDRDFRMTMDIDLANEPFDDYPEIKNELDRRGIEYVRGVLMPEADEIQSEQEYVGYDYAFKAIKVFTPTPEMLVCIKALTDRKKDYHDIFESGILDFCDIEHTIGLIEEYKGFLLNINPLLYHVDDVLEVLIKMV